MFILKSCHALLAIGQEQDPANRCINSSDLMAAGVCRWKDSPLRLAISPGISAICSGDSKTCPTPNRAYCRTYPEKGSRSHAHRKTGMPKVAHSKAVEDCTVKAN